jgi:protein SCO1/2
MMATRRVLELAFLVCLLTPACKGKAPAAGGPRYPLAGKVVEVDVVGRTITIAHGDIPGFMSAMTMPFVVLEKDAALLKDLGVGDEVTATLVSRDSRFWLEELAVVRKGTPDPNAQAPPAAHLAKPGDSLPAVALVDQDGNVLRLGDLRGQAVALTFVYTRCPLPDYCPLMMRNFQRAESLLIADAALRERTRLVTVSFDPKHDTPEVLRRFGAIFQETRPPFAHWTLATGDEDAIRTLGQALELVYVEESRSFTHNLRTAVVGPDGKLRRLFRGNAWKPEELVAELRKAAS